MLLGRGTVCPRCPYLRYRVLVVIELASSRPSGRLGGMTYTRYSIALLVFGFLGCSGASNGGGGGGGGGGGAPNDTSACEASVEYLGGDDVGPYTVGHAPWCTDCSFESQATLDPGFDDHGYTARVVMSPGGQPTLLAVGPAEQSQAVWASPNVSDAVAPLPGVSVGAAFLATDGGAPYALFPATSPGQLRLRDPSGAEEILACDEPYAMGLGVAMEGDQIHAVAAYVLEEDFLNNHLTAFSRGADGSWSDKPLGDLSEGPIALARAASGKWLAIGNPPYVDGDVAEGLTLLIEDGSPRQVDLPSPMMEEDFYGPYFQPHPRLQIIPGEDDYLALMSVGGDLVTVLLADGGRVEIPAPQVAPEACQFSADNCMTECATLGSATVSASAFIDGESLFVVMAQYTTDRLYLYDCQGSGDNCDCTETLDHDDQQAELVIARYDLATLSGGVIFEEPIPGELEEVWMSASPAGENLVVAFKELGIAAVRVGTLDLGMLRAL